jgi:gamma-glutamyl:cysteine ligase YbdK (ATP-grasp superfamily)
MVGIEIELSAVKEDGNYAAGAAKHILAGLTPELWREEAGSGSIEFASAPVALQSGAISSLFAQASAEIGAAASLAASKQLGLIGSGIAPVIGPNQVEEPGMSSETEQLLSALGNEEETTSTSLVRSVHLGFEEGGSFQLTTKNAAWTVINALHVTFQTRDPIDALQLFNALRDLTPLMMAISSNTGALNGKKLDHQEYRPFIIAGSEIIDYNLESCSGIVIERAQSLRHAFELLVPREPSRACPKHWLSSGATPSIRDAFESVREATFPSVQMRLGRANPSTFLIEYRPMSAQLSVARNVALAGFLSLATEYLIAHPDSHISEPTELLEDTKSALKHGMNAPVHALVGPQKGVLVPAYAVALDLLDRAQEHGLRMGTIGSEDLSALSCLRTALERRESCSDVLTRAISDFGPSEGLKRNWIAPRA